MRKAKVLVVEDEVLIALDLKLALEGMGHSVVGVASSGEEAVMLAKANGPDIVLMDYQLSGKMNGVEAGRKISESGSRAHFIFLTAFTREKFGARPPLSGKFGYVAKPFDIRSVEAEIRKALGKKQRDR